jgi:hypothetical protein
MLKGEITLRTIALVVAWIVIGQNSYGAEPVVFIEKVGVSQKAAYQSAKDWMAMTFNDSNSAIKVADESRAKIIAKAFIPSTLPGCKPLNIESTIEFEAKDKRIRISFNDLTISKVQESEFMAKQMGGNPIAGTDKYGPNCLRKIADQLKKYINEHKTNNNW